MAYKFKSRATADLIMLDANARKLLEIMGKSPDDAQGIITVAQIPAAIAALEAAAAQEHVPQKAQPEDESQDEDVESASHEHVGLAQRVVPLIDMLRRSAAEGKDVTW